MLLLHSGVCIAQVSVGAGGSAIVSLDRQATTATSSVETASPCGRCIPALTPVSLVVDSALGSAISKTGQVFQLHLASSIVVDGKELIPAGIKGTGEVVWAKRAGGSGAAGELVLAARTLDFGGRLIRLRSMRVAIVGKDAIGTIDAINAGAAAAMPVASIIGFAITGHDVVYPAGSSAAAKLAEAFVIDDGASAPAAAAVSGSASVAPPASAPASPTVSSPAAKDAVRQPTTD